MTDRSPQQVTTEPVPYAWSSIVMGTRNYGNYLIEWSLKQLLALPEPRLVFDSFKPMNQSVIDQINQTCRFVINPGCTTLQPGENAAFEAFGQITVPKPCFGGCLWEFGNRSKLNLALTIIGPAGYGMHSRVDKTPELTVARDMTAPVGTRDPYTDDRLTTAGIKSMLIGCPTVLSPDPVREWKKPQGRRLTVSLARYALPAQLRLIRRLSRTWDVRVLIHEEYERYAVKLLGGIKTVGFKSVEQFFGHYRDCDAVLTGRLHGALPAIRFGRPVLFFGNAGDTRFSLLRHLGLPIRPFSSELAQLEHYPEIANPDPNIFQNVHQRAKKFAAYCQKYGIPSRLMV